MTSGLFDDRNPAVSPDGKIIAFDSNRPSTDPLSADTRDIWVMGAAPDATPRRVTNFTGSSNIEPAWNSGIADKWGIMQDAYGKPLIQLLFASNRMDSKGDGNADAINSNGSHDLYRLVVRVIADPLNTSYETLVNPE